MRYLFLLHTSDAALAAYRAALALGPPAAEVAFVTRRMAEIA